MAGDVGIVPRNMGHFIENLSDDEPLEILEIFRADKFQDFSLFQWLGETPRRMVAEHLFATSPKAAKKFLEQIEGAEKDVIKSQYQWGAVSLRESVCRPWWSSGLTLPPCRLNTTTIKENYTWEYHQILNTYVLRST
jgi:hypothetical protein